MPDGLFDRRLWSATLRWLATLSLPVSLAGAGFADDRLRSELEGLEERWVEGVGHLMAEAELRTFSELASGLERELFVRRFWQRREGGLLERWRGAFEEASQRFESLDGDRARALLIAGKPARADFFESCGGVIRPVEIWSYEPWHVRRVKGEPEASGFLLLFVRPSQRQPRLFRHWSRLGGTSPLVFGEPPRGTWTLEALAELFKDEGCGRRVPDGAGLFERALTTALDASELRRTLVPPAPDDGWVESFRAELPAARLPATGVEVDFPGRYGRRTVVRGRLRVPASELERNAEGQLFDRVTIRGDVRWQGRLVDAFRVVHYVAGAEPAGGSIEVDFHRRLAPRRYTLSVRVEDGRGLPLLREEEEIEVPEVEREAEPPAGFTKGFHGLLRRDVARLRTFPSVEIRLPGRHLLAGRVSVEALTTGGPIDRVGFRLDGTPAGEVREPPYIAELRLAASPQRGRLEAVAFDAAGRELARDSIELNTEPQSFDVRVLEPLAAGPETEARMEVDVPAGGRLERIDLYLNRRHLGTLREAPFVHPVPETHEEVSGITYLRAVARLTDGRSAEDTVLLHTADPVEEIDVRLVELYTSVVDPRGRPVAGLTEADLVVREDGVVQPLQEFALVEKLPIRVALLMDVSGSMRGRVSTAAASAERFFTTILRRDDSASLVAFNHEIDPVVPFTSDVDRLRFGTRGFRAWGTTRLHDSLIYTLHSFGGLEGKRALVLLSDGIDVDSDFELKQVLELALRAGVAVYPIRLEAREDEVSRLAAETGGRSFSIAAVSELDAVYRRIEEELRSQYLLVYRSPRGGRRFRRVEVEVLRDGLRARTLSGYYP